MERSPYGASFWSASICICLLKWSRQFGAGTKVEFRLHVLQNWVFWQNLCVLCVLAKFTPKYAYMGPPGLMKSWWNFDETQFDETRQNTIIKPMVFNHLLMKPTLMKPTGLMNNWWKSDETPFCNDVQQISFVFHILLCFICCLVVFVLARSTKNETHKMSWQNMQANFH